MSKRAKQQTKVVELQQRPGVIDPELAARLIRTGAIERAREAICGTLLQQWADCRSKEAREELWFKFQATEAAFSEIVAQLTDNRGDIEEYSESLWSLDTLRARIRKVMAR